MPRVRFPKIHLQCKVYLQRDSVFFVHFTDAVKKDPSSTSLQRWVKENLMMGWVTTDAQGSISQNSSSMQSLPVIFREIQFFFVQFTDAVKKDPSSTSLQRWVKEHLMMDWVTTKDAKGLGSFFLPIQLRMINAPKMHLRK